MLVLYFLKEVLLLSIVNYLSSIKTEVSNFATLLWHWQKSSQIITNDRTSNERSFYIKKQLQQQVRINKVILKHFSYVVIVVWNMVDLFYIEKKKVLPNLLEYSEIP